MEGWDETLVTHCGWLIEKETGCSVSAFIAKINGAHAAHKCLGPCTSVWVAGSLAVRCKTCQQSNTSAICIDCFKAGNHEGHDFSIYASPAGGACDCGDLSSFSYEGCCPRHRPAPSGAPPQGPAPSLPDLISPAELRVLTLTLSVTLARLTLVATVAADPAHRHRTAAAGHVSQLSKFLSGFVGLTPVRPLACQLVMSGLQQEGPPPSDPPQTPSASYWRVAFEILEQAGRETRVQLAGIAGQLCGGMHQSMLAVLLRQLPHVSSQHKVASVDLTTFLLLLLYDTDCKNYTSVHILACYSGFLSKIMEDALPHHPLTTALDRLTVQLFNSEEVTYRLTCESSLLQILVDMLYDVAGRVLDVLNTPPRDQAHENALLAESKVLWHCHRRVQGDLNSVLHYPKVAAAFVTQQDVRSKFLACMERAQCMMRHHRKTSGDMVPMPSFKTQCAMNLEMLLISTVPEVEGVLGRRHNSVDSDGQHVHLLHQAASAALLATFQWASGGQTSLLDAFGASSREMGQASRSSQAHSETPSGTDKSRPSGKKFLTGLSQRLPLPPFLTARLSGGQASDSGGGEGGPGGEVMQQQQQQQHGSPLSILPPTRVFWEALLSGSLGVSAHLPLHRTFAGLVSALINCEHAAAPQVAVAASSALQDVLRLLRVYTPQAAQVPRQPPKQVPAWQHTQRHVLLLQCFFMQVRLRLWILNGDDIVMLDAMYQGFRELRDLDLLLLQLSMAAGPPAESLVELLYGLGAGPLLHSAGVSHPPLNEPTSQYLADKRRLRGCECALQLLLVLLRDRITCGAPKARVRQLLLQWLAIKDTGHAQLVQALPTDLQQAWGPYIDEVLKELAIYRSPSLAAPGKYMLKAEAWRSFDPNSSLYTPLTKQKALERAGQAGYKPHWSLSPPGPLPPSLEPMRSVLATPELYMLVHHILAQAVSPSPLFSSEDLALSALNLLALQLHYTKELIAPSASVSGVGDSGSTSTSSSSPAKEAVSLAAVALQGGSCTTPAAASFGPGILTLLAQKAGPAGAATGAQQGGPVDDVTDCCAYLVKLAEEVLSTGRAVGLLPGAAAPHDGQPTATATAAAAAQAGGGSVEGDAAADLKARAKARQAEAMAKLRAQQAAFFKQAQAAGEGSDTDMEPGPTPAHAAAPGATTGSQAGGAEAMDEDMTRLEELLGLASSSHTAPLLQQQQQQEEEQARPLHGRWGPWTGPAGSSSDGECVVCKQAGSRQEPLGWLGHIQTSGTLMHSLSDPCKWDEDAGTDAPPQPPSSASFSCGSLSQQWASCVARRGPWAGCQADWAPGLHTLCCGHQMHVRCFEAQRQRSLVLAATGLVLPASMHASIRHREITCPVCRRLGNVLFPAADFIWQPCQPLPTTTTTTITTTTTTIATAATATPPSSVSPPPPPPPPPPTQAHGFAEEGLMMQNVFGHMAPLAQRLVEQARLEGDLHVSSLGSALKRRAAMVEQSSTEAPSQTQQQQQQQQPAQTPQQQHPATTTQQPLQQHPAEAEQQQGGQPQQQGSPQQQHPAMTTQQPLQQQPAETQQQQGGQLQQQGSPQHASLLQGGGRSSGGNALGAASGSGASHAGNDEDMQDAHAPAVDAAQAEQATPLATQSGGAAATPWACAVKCSTVVEARDAIQDASLPQLLWAALAHNVAHWEAMHRPLAAAPAFNASRHPRSRTDANTSTTTSTTSSNNQGGPGLQVRLLSQAGPASRSSSGSGGASAGVAAQAQPSSVAGAPSLPVVDTAHWRGVRGLAGMCLALGCAQADACTASPGTHAARGSTNSSSSSSSSSSSYGNDSSATSSSTSRSSSGDEEGRSVPSGAEHSARQDLRDALCWLFGGDQGGTNTSTTTTTTTTPPSQQQQQQQQQEGSSTPQQQDGDRRAPVALSSGFPPRYDTAFATATLRRHQTSTPDARDSPDTRAGASAPVLQRRVAETLPQLVPDPFTLLLELLALGSSAYGDKKGSRAPHRAHAGDENEGRMLEDGAQANMGPRSSNHAPQGRHESAGGAAAASPSSSSSFWSSPAAAAAEGGVAAGGAAAAAAAAAEADAMEVYLARRASSGHALLAGLVDILLPLCATQAAVWACLTGFTSQSAADHTALTAAPTHAGTPATSHRAEPSANTAGPGGLRGGDSAAHAHSGAHASGIDVSPRTSLSGRVRVLFLPWLLGGSRWEYSGSAAPPHTSAAAHTSASVQTPATEQTTAAHTRAGVDAFRAGAQEAGAARTATMQAGLSEGADAELLEVVAVQVLPFLVRAHVLLRALQPHGRPDDDLLQTYALLQPHQQPQQQQQQQQQQQHAQNQHEQPPQQQQLQHEQHQLQQVISARSLADRLCASMDVSGLGLALSRGLTAVAPPAELSHYLSTTAEVPLDKVSASSVCLHRWCGHLLWALHAHSQPSTPSTVPPPTPAASPPAPAAAALTAQQSMGIAPSNSNSTSTSSCAIRLCPLPAPPSLIALPPLFQDLLLHFAGKVCTHCKQLPEHPCLCLATGQLLCSWWTGCVKSRGGGTLHAAEACTGSTLMLSLKSTKVVALRGPRIIVVQSPYLDAHGEEDPELRRGRPLYLQPSIYAHLSKLWSSAALDYDSVLLHSSRSDLDLL